MTATEHEASRIPRPGDDYFGLAARGDPPPDRATSDSQNAHLWRLCLDLQLDSLLLAIGAAAVTAEPTEGPSTGHQASAPAPDEGLPWRRWVTEDVDLACVLASDSLAGGATVPSTLGSDLHQTAPTAAIDSLVARFASMRSLLADLAELRPAWGSQVEQVTERCERRLDELQNLRLATVPPPERARTGRQPGYLPGELLG